MNLLQSKQVFEHELQSLSYGSVEIRENNSNKYIYVHYREDGVALTKYVGEYSDELYNLILNNSIKAKQLKKQIKEITKKLKQFNYIEEELSEKVEQNIDFAKRHLVDTIYKQAILEGVATTFADTESIIEGGKVNNMTSEDIIKIVNLKHAWEFILNKNVVLSDTNFALLCEINKMVEEGKSVIMISSEMPELLGMCDRIYVMSEGRLAGEFTAEEATQERIMASIMQEQNKK